MTRIHTKILTGSVALVAAGLHLVQRWLRNVAVVALDQLLDLSVEVSLRLWNIPARLSECHAYLLWDIDRDMDTLNVTPEAALHTMQAQQRSPLTIEEDGRIAHSLP